MTKGRARTVIDVLVKQWLLLGSLAGLLASSLFLRRIPSIPEDDLHILFLLFALFLTVKGVEESGFLENMASKLEKGGHIATKLALVTFFSSMFFTNDAALVVAVPLTLQMRVKNKAFLVILESLAVNAGSALTPFGNPQNLYIYWHFKVAPLAFFKVMAPFSIAMLVLLIVLSSYFDARNTEQTAPRYTSMNQVKSVIFLSGMALVILSILKVLPLYFVPAAVVILSMYEPTCLKVDYALIVTMLAFMGISENFQAIFQGTIEHSHHVFLLSCLGSQVISNVPAALLFAKFTANWKALSWGTNVGGFGGLIGSLANLIAYKIYISSKEKEVHIARFTWDFVGANYAFFTVGIGLFYLLKDYL